MKELYKSDSEEEEAEDEEWTPNNETRKDSQERQLTSCEENEDILQKEATDEMSHYEESKISEEENQMCGEDALCEEKNKVNGKEDIISEKKSELSKAEDLISEDTCENENSIPEKKDILSEKEDGMDKTCEQQDEKICEDDENQGERKLCLMEKEIGAEEQRKVEGEGGGVEHLMIETGAVSQEDEDVALGDEAVDDMEELLPGMSEEMHPLPANAKKLQLNTQDLDDEAMDHLLLLDEDSNSEVPVQCPKLSNVEETTVEVAQPETPLHPKLSKLVSKLGVSVAENVRLSMSPFAPRLSASTSTSGVIDLDDDFAAAKAPNPGLSELMDRFARHSNASKKHHKKAQQINLE